MTTTQQTFRLEIVTPGVAYPPREVVSLNVPAEEGRLTVLARHQPFICCLAGGTARITSGEGELENWNLGPGTMTVSRDTVAVLVREAQRA